MSAKKKVDDKKMKEPNSKQQRWKLQLQLQKQAAVTKILIHSSFQSAWSLSKSEMSPEQNGLVAEWRHSSTHYLLLLTVGGKALGQQGTVLQQHFGDRLWKQDNTQVGDVYSGNLWSSESELVFTPLV